MNAPASADISTETDEPTVETPVAPAAPAAPADDSSPGAGEEEEETTAPEANTVALPASANLPGPFRALVGRVLGLTSGDTAALKAEAQDLRGQLATAMTDLSAARAERDAKVAELAAVQKALEDAVAATGTVEKKALATVAALGVPGDDLPRASGHDDASAATATPHLDAFEKLDGAAAATYWKEHAAAIRKEDARRAACNNN